MVEFDKIEGYMSMSVPDWVVYVVALILFSILGLICWQGYKVLPPQKTVLYEWRKWILQGRQHTIARSSHIPRI